MTSKYDGKIFGNLVVVNSFTQPNKNGHQVQMFEVRCACGRSYEVQSWSVVSGARVSCAACRKGENARSSAVGYKHPLYGIWRAAADRCHNATSSHFKWYGARGVYMCDRWRGEVPPGGVANIAGFHAFIADMGARPDGTSLGRIDNDGPYAPENCRWETTEQQANNKRSNRVIGCGGRALTVAQWARELGVPGSWAQAADKYEIPLSTAVRLLSEPHTAGKWQQVFSVCRRKRAPTLKPPKTPLEVAEFASAVEADWEEFQSVLPKFSPPPNTLC